MDITDVMNNHSEGERLLICFFRENLCDLFDIDRSFLCLLSLKETSEFSKRVSDVYGRHRKVWEVIQACVIFIKVGLVDEVPVVLEPSKRVLDFVSECSALCEWVISL